MVIQFLVYSKKKPNNHKNQYQLFIYLDSPFVVLFRFLSSLSNIYILYFSTFVTKHEPMIFLNNNTLVLLNDGSINQSTNQPINQPINLSMNNINTYYSQIKNNDNI